jgi:hypothetical protein
VYHPSRITVTLLQLPGAVTTVPGVSYSYIVTVARVTKLGKEKLPQSPSSSPSLQLLPTGNTMNNNTVFLSFGG